jgi:hypothetical protein
MWVADLAIGWFATLGHHPIGGPFAAMAEPLTEVDAAP